MRWVGLVVAVVLTAACSTSGDGDTPGSEPSVRATAAATAQPDPWDGLRIYGDEVEGYRSFNEMLGAADLTVVGELTPGGTRLFQGDAVEDRVTYSVGALRIDETLAGRAPTQNLTVEFLSDSPVPSGRVLLFLRDKGGSEQGRYRAVNSRGLWTSTIRSPVDSPLTPAAPMSPVVGPFDHELRTHKIQSLKGLARYVRGLR